LNEQQHNESCEYIRSVEHKIFYFFLQILSIENDSWWYTNLHKEIDSHRKYRRPQLVYWIPVNLLTSSSRRKIYSKKVRSCAQQNEISEVCFRFPEKENKSVTFSIEHSLDIEIMPVFLEYNSVFWNRSQLF
jgi:hypothetical protein